jgi:hypothetical protein
MGKINTGRVILGGLVAGIILDILGFLVDGIWLAPQWADGMKALGHAEFGSSQLVWINLLGLATGIAAIWLYAGIRPRFGAGVKTAVLAGVAVWVLGWLLPNLDFMWFSGLFAHPLTAMTTGAGLVEVLLGVVAGAYLYKEAAA